MISHFVVHCSSGGSSVPPEKGWLWSNKGQGQKRSIRNKLREKNFRPKKSLGQNFMEDDDVLMDIVSKAGVDESSLVLEIGPGTGAMTNFLLSKGALVTAVEKDDRLYEDLYAMYAEDEQIQIIHGDILRENMVELADDLKRRSLAMQSTSAQTPKVVANLPYNITKEFLLKSLPLGGEVFSSLFLMLQHEVAERLINNQSGSSDWRAMNILIQYYCEPKYLFKIDRLKYSPVPKVDGALAKFRLKTRQERISVPSEKEFVSLVKRAFLQRRKMLTNSLQPLLNSSEIAKCLTKAELPIDCRAQALSLEDFVRLSWAMHSQGELVK